MKLHRCGKYAAFWLKTHEFKITMKGKGVKKFLRKILKIPKCKVINYLDLLTGKITIFFSCPHGRLHIFKHFATE